MPLTKYMDALPVPPVLKPEKRLGCHSFYTVKMTQFKQKLHSELPPTLVWGYEGRYPGPTIVANRNEKVNVKWENHLPVYKHLLPVDTTVHGAGPEVPPVRTVVHLHGAKVAPDSDGYPEAWYTNGYEIYGPDFKRKTYQYTNEQRAATLWYHDHALGITRLNVYAGLAGFYLIHDLEEMSLNLPSGAYDIPLVIQDRSFQEDGSLSYPSQPPDPSPDLPDPSIVPGFFGDTILVNGMVWPYLDVEPRKYRFRLLNGSNTRFYDLKLEDKEEEPLPIWVQIGTDGGLLEAPVQLEHLVMAPAERAEVVIDFTGLAGREIRLTNSQQPFDVDTTGQVMQFRVCLPLSKPDTSTVPEDLSTIKPIPQSQACLERNMFFRVTLDQYGRPHFMLNGLMWDDPVTEKPPLGSTEIWNIINSGLGTHPIHIHLIQFQIISRQPFDIALYNSTGEVKFTGPAAPPDANEAGWKDTVRAQPGFVTKIIMRFEGYTGSYVWHCHILEHEDYDMMRPLEVMPKGACDELTDPGMDH